LENSQETDSARLSSLDRALGAVAAKMDPPAAAEIARRGAQRLTAALENPQETNFNHLSDIGSALAAVAAKMDPQAAAEIVRRGAQRLAAALENPQETDSARLSDIGKTLAALCALLPSAHYTHLRALSNLLLTPISGKAADGKEQI
jgi:general stress protein YciG